MRERIFPLDNQLQLSPGAFSPYLMESIARLGTELTFERAPELLGFFTRVQVGVETVRRITEAAGALLQEMETAQVTELERTLPQGGPQGAQAQQLSADGAMVHLVHDGWAEVKTLAIGTIAASPEGQVHARDISYFSRLAPAEEFRRLAQVELWRCGTYQADPVCAVVDGAEWLQKFVDWHVPKAVRILDFPHAAEHVNGAAQAVYGPGTAAASDWLGQQLHTLRHGNPDEVIDALRALPVDGALDAAAATKTRDDVVAYLEKRRAQISYADFAAAGYPIGSGMVESANKLVVEARLKGSGMHWARPNVNKMLALRTAACSGRWSEVWPPVWSQFCSTQRKSRRAPGEPPTPSPLTEPPQATPPPPPPPLRVPQIKLENLGLVVNGRPTSRHPWKPSLSHNSPSTPH